MFEEIIMQLDTLGIAYSEEGGTLVIDISTTDKMTIIDVINIVNNSGMEFMVDENSVTVQSGQPVETEEEEPDYQAAAMNEMML